jgi:hypothetical protein
MATTVTAPVGNTIALAEKYLPILDEIYKAGSRSAILDTASERVRWDGAKKAYLFNTQLVGLSNYDRNAGFVPGDATDGWEDYEITQDRGRSFMIDVMDNDETLGMAFGTLVGEFERTQVIPELDAYRFAKYASGAAAAQVITETLSAGAATIASIDTATAALDNAEVPYEGRILFVNPNTYKLIKSGVTRMVMNGENNVNYNVEMYNDMRLITVPSGRFNTAVTINAPTTSAAAGGYTASGDAINYMIIHPSAVLQVVKHAIPRIFSPEVNQEADAWKFDYRVYHDAWVETQKTNGIYVSHA